ncbi:Uncharacterized protein FWK35_00029830 [Aphis craccivora]|uniref:Integrase catalytic domain-containing protein n=1 Tax=Aphis craccivora TaxID=307492 RepID=A0A6G0VWG5_APHCR|nr:Uncharacterized protein FWK35_00029830 [Aphis craccivora]
MDANGEVLGELIKAKKNIKRKYSELKLGEADIHSLVSDTLNPIIEPLNDLKNYKPLQVQSTQVPPTQEADDYQDFEITNWFKSYDIDKTYGPKINTNRNMYLEKKEIKLVDNTLIIEDSRRFENKKGGNKYADIIQNLFSSDSGLSVKLQKHNLVYWNDSNELVDRLRLLLASKAAGNTGVSIEILSIFEELREASVIKHCFTKFAWAIPLKSKTAKEVSTAMSKILLECSPKLLQLDIAKMFREFTARGSHEWISILLSLINKYNNSKHRTIGMTPVQADANPSSVVIKQQLKHGKADIHSLVSDTLSPIIELLNDLKNYKPLEVQPTPVPPTQEADDYQHFEITDWLKSYDIDKTYGPKINTNGNMTRKFNIYFSKSPKLYTNKDLKTYKSILNQTSAHLTADGSKIKKGGNKYADIIQNLFPSGSGITMKLQKHNLVYWNDPNELVDRLRLLLASKAAGNTGVSNEILSIFEESREAGPIKHCFTKFAWAIPLKSKTAKEVSTAIFKILLKCSPKLLQLDNGKEFYNSTFDALMEKHNIYKYSTYSTMKACIVERFNHTLKAKMFREFTARGSHEWFSILPKLINEYNNSKHRTIGMTPVQADANPSSVVIKHRKIINGSIKFNVGDNVRISKYKGVFAKGYLPSWSTEIFKIVKINETLPTTYQLQDYTGTPIAGCFYYEELLKTNYPNDYLVEKIIRRKGKQIYVKWLGFDSTHNSWINTSDIRK